MTLFSPCFLPFLLVTVLVIERNNTQFWTIQYNISVFGMYRFQN